MSAHVPSPAAIAKERARHGITHLQAVRKLQGKRVLLDRLRSERRAG